MSKLAYLIAVAGLVAPAPVLAQGRDVQAVPAPLPPANAKPKSDDDKVVCKRQEEIGSRLISNKVCMTVAQWRQYEIDNREKLQRLQESAGTRPSG
jgi:hypothetical protein